MDTDATTARPRPATIIDVARDAGVAIGTVSRYLQGKPVRGENRERIEATIQRLRFRRSAVAHAMRAERTQIIGLLVPSFFEEYHGVLMEHLSRTLRRDGLALLVYCHSRDPKLISEGLDFLMRQQVDALIMSGAASVAEPVGDLVGDGLPVVVFNNDVPGVPVSRVFVDNRRAASRAVRHLIDLGHRRIALISGNRSDSSGLERYQGYEDALREAGIDFDTRLVADGEWTMLGGELATRRLMALPQPPTALLSANGPMTHGALKQLRDAGRRLPDEISLVSFDDSPLLSLHQPGITVISQPIAAIAETISELLLRQLADRSTLVASRAVIDCEFILRGSTRPPQP